MRRFYSSLNVPEFEAHSVTKVIRKKGDLVKPPRKREERIVTTKTEEIAQNKNHNINEMGIQMISRKLYQQVFKNMTPQSMDHDHIEK